MSTCKVECIADSSTLLVFGMRIRFECTKMQIFVGAKGTKQMKLT